MDCDDNASAWCSDTDRPGGGGASSAHPAQGLLDHLKREGVLATGLYRLRFVTHRDVDGAGVDRAAAAIRQFLRR